MASSTLKFYCLNMIVLLIFFLLLIQESSSGCSNGQQRCFYANAASPVNVKNRKVLVASNGEKLEVINRELRAVPSGPDPLHHNGGSPKKPATP